MKLTITTILLFVCAVTYGQTYKSIIAQSDSLFKIKQYRKSVIQYQKAFKIEQKSELDFYKAGCAASLLGNKQLAFKWLNLAIKNGWSNIEETKIDSDLISLHNSEKWNNLLTEIQKKADKKRLMFDKPLQSKLLKIYDRDQNIRVELIAARKEFGVQSKEVDSLGRIMEHRDSLNLMEVTKILDEYGWVGRDKVGAIANVTIFFVIQHADLKTQQKYLPMMKQAVKSGNAEGSALALLEDRINIRQGKLQVYGSQTDLNKETGKIYVSPLKDPDKVDKRRAEVGLEPLADYIKQWGIIWNVAEYKKQLPELKKKLKGKTW